MTRLDSWLADATRRLAKDSAAQVRMEIQEHYELARDAAQADGATLEESETLALGALGDAKTVNCQYRRVLVTSAEARVLREGNWEARAFCSRAWLRWLIFTVPLATVGAALACFLLGRAAFGRDLLMVAVGMSPMAAARILPVYSFSRSLAFRRLKWVALTVSVLSIYGAATLTWSWLLFSCLWPLVSIERTRASLRRKLPIEAWPKHLYL